MKQLIINNFNKFISQGSKFAIFTLKEGMYGHSLNKLTLSFNGTTYDENQDLVINKKFYQKIVLNESIDIEEILI